MPTLLESLTAIKRDWERRSNDTEEASRIRQLAMFPETQGQLFVNYFAKKLVQRYLAEIRMTDRSIATYADSQPHNPPHSAHDIGLDPHDWTYSFRIAQHTFDLYACNNKVEWRTARASGGPLNNRLLRREELTAEGAVALFIGSARTALENY